jgi:hypothetical protein
MVQFHSGMKHFLFVALENIYNKKQMSFLDSYIC